MTISNTVRHLSMSAIRQRKRLEEIEYANSQLAVTKCACGWYFRGTVGDGKQAFRSHREVKHS